MTYRSDNSTGLASREWPESRRSRLELAVAPAAVRIARHWTAGQLAGTGPGPGRADADLVDSAVLAVSELVTNAIAAASQDATDGEACAAAGQSAAAGQVCAAAARPGLTLAGTALAGTALAGTALAATVAASGMLPGRFLSFGDVPRGHGLPGPVAALGAALSAGLSWPWPSPSPSPRVSLVIARLNTMLRIEVRDSSRVPLPPTCHRDAEDETGRGLLVVAALAKTWGWQPEPFGKVVWCELAS